MSRTDGDRDALDQRVLAWIGEATWRSDDARFERLALDLFAFQYRHCEPYRRFCDARGGTPRTVHSWTAIPAVPTGAFKETALRCYPALRTRHVFRTSGTSTSSPGELHLDTLELYEASLLPTFRNFVLPDLRDGERIRMRVLAPAPQEAPDSSLSHMFGCVLRAFGSGESGFDVADGALRTGPLLAALRGAGARGEAILLAGTAFAFVHLLEALGREGSRLALPAGSRLIETGGFKGRARERSREDLYAELTMRLGIPPSRMVNQYGMTELASQFYDSNLVEPESPRRKLGPPWARVRVLDPETGAESPQGAPGILCVVDLANTGSVLAVQTADLGRRSADGFEVLGRAAGAEARGCSIAADLMLGGGAP